MADEPVSAWREPWRRRLRRWLARHRGLAASAAGALVIVSVVAATAAVLIERARRDKVSALNARTEALAAEVKAKAEADRRLKDANAVVDTFLGSVADELDRVQGAQAIRRKLLSQAADYFAEVSRERSSDPNIEYEALRTAYRSGKVRRELGDIEKAIATYEGAARRGEELLQTTGHEARFVHLLASTHFELALCKAKLGARMKQRPATGKQSATSATQWRIEPDDVETINNMASVHNNLGILLRDRNELGEAESQYRRAVELRRELVKRKPDSLKYSNDLGSSLTNLGMLEGDRGKAREAVKLQRESVAMHERVVQLDSDSPRGLRGLAVSLGNLAGALGSAGSDLEAVQVHKRRVQRGSR